MMLDLLWVDGLTIKDMKIRRPGYWTVHPTFSNNVRVTGNSIVTDLVHSGTNTDGCVNVCARARVCVRARSCVDACAMSRPCRRSKLERDFALCC
jgi:polygalacturonase